MLKCNTLCCNTKCRLLEPLAKGYVPPCTLVTTWVPTNLEFSVNVNLKGHTKNNLPVVGQNMRDIWLNLEVGYNKFLRWNVVPEMS